MLGWVLKRVFGSKHAREVKRLLPAVARINEIETQYQQLSDEQLKAKTQEFKERLQKGETTEALLPEAFAAVKNACRRMVGSTIDIPGQVRSWDMVPFDVQLIGGIALHRGSIAEMQTGEGKTLVAILPLYLNALTGKNCQLVTTNDFLARRDAMWVGSVLRWLGLTVGYIQSGMPPSQRRLQYQCDVTYGTSSEFGFDYLRDMGMASSLEEMVQRGHFFAIVDEVDSILVDEARTPLIISGPVPVDSYQYERYKPQVERLVKMQHELCSRLAAQAREILGKEAPSAEEYDRAILNLIKIQIGMPTHKQLLRLLEDPKVRREFERQEGQVRSDQNRGMLQEIKDELYFGIDEKAGDADLSELGRRTLSPNDPDAFVLPDLAAQFSEIDGNPALSDEDKYKQKQERQAIFDERSQAIHNIAQLLRAYCCFELDRHYIIEEGKVVIVDERTGRPMYGRRYSDGLHQALEAKEGVKIEEETQTLATITIQNYFRMYAKLAGMTGTAETEANEFKDIYNLDVLVIPTNRPCVRKDLNDVMYKTRNAKYAAIVEEVKAAYEQGQPVLLGTVSVEASERVSKLLERQRIPHTVLNAKHHQREAEIVALAGQRGAVTIATNMAGRGTDIRLGEGVSTHGGLYVIGSERHDSRRIDRQLRGRCARQGDPGQSRFYISLEDELMRLFGGDRITRIMEKFGLEDGEELSHSWLNTAVENAQRKVEAHHFSIRKRTLQFDDVMNKHREVVYGQRNEILHTKEPRKLIFEYLDAAIFDQFQLWEQSVKETGAPFNREEMMSWLRRTFPPVPFEPADLDCLPAAYDPEALTKRLVARISHAYDLKLKGEHPEMIERLERQVILTAIDRLWQEHLYNMDQLRNGVYLHSHAQRDPLVEYKREGYEMFRELLGKINEEVAMNTFRSTTSLQNFAHFLSSLPQQEMHQLLGQFDVGQRQALEASIAAQHAQRVAPPAPPPAAAPTRTAGSAGAAVEEPGSETASADGEEGSSRGGFAPPPQRGIPYVRELARVGRNDACPCGSGKKYKKCCGKDQAGL